MPGRSRGHSPAALSEAPCGTTVWGSLTLSAWGVTLLGHSSLGFELHCPAPPHVAETHRTKLPLTCLSRSLGPRLCRSCQAGNAVGPGLLPHRPPLSNSHCRNLATHVPLPESPQLSLLRRGYVSSGHSKRRLGMLTEHLGPKPRHLPYWSGVV